MFGFWFVDFFFVFLKLLYILLCLIAKVPCELEMFMGRDSLESLTEPHLLMSKLLKRLSWLSCRGQSEQGCLHGLGEVIISLSFLSKTCLLNSSSQKRCEEQLANAGTMFWLPDVVPRCQERLPSVILSGCCHSPASDFGSVSQEGKENRTDSKSLSVVIRLSSDVSITIPHWFRLLLITLINGDVSCSTGLKMVRVPQPED